MVLNAGQSSSFKLGRSVRTLSWPGLAQRQVSKRFTRNFKVRKDSTNTTIAGGVLTADTSVTTESVVAGRRLLWAPWELKR